MCFLAFLVWIVWPEKEKGHAEGLRDGYAPRVLDQADQKAQLTDSGSYFTGEIRADAEGDYLGDVIITLGADSYRLRS